MYSKSIIDNDYYLPKDATRTHDCNKGSDVKLKKKPNGGKNILPVTSSVLMGFTIFRQFSRGRKYCLLQWYRIQYLPAHKSVGGKSHDNLGQGGN